MENLAPAYGSMPKRYDNDGHGGGNEQAKQNPAAQTWILVIARRTEALNTRTLLKP
jgi:hypothetical protein